MAQENKKRGGSFRKATPSKKSGGWMDQIYNLQPFLIGSIVFLIVTILLFVTVSLANIYLEDRIESLDEKIASIQNDLNKGVFERQLSSILSFPGKVKSVESVIDNHLKVSRFYDFLKDNTLENVRFNVVNFDIRNSELNLGGIASNFETLSRQLAQFKLSLGDSSENFASNMTLGSTMLSEKGVQFDLVFELNKNYFLDNK